MALGLGHRVDVVISVSKPTASSGAEAGANPDAYIYTHRITYTVHPNSMLRKRSLTNSDSKIDPNHKAILKHIKHIRNLRPWPKK